MKIKILICSFINQNESLYLIRCQFFNNKNKELSRRKLHCTQNISVIKCKTNYSPACTCICQVCDNL